MVFSKKKNDKLLFFLGFKKKLCVYDVKLHLYEISCDTGLTHILIRNRFSMIYQCIVSERLNR